MSADHADVQAAETEAAEAAELLAALEERVLDGDATVTHAQLAEHRDLLNFAQMRAQAARRKADKEQAAARRTEYEALAAEVAALDGQAAPVRAAYAEALAALGRLVDVEAELSDRVRAAHARTAQARTVAEEHGEVELLRSTGVLGADGGPAGRSVHYRQPDGARQTWTLLPPGEVAALALRRSIEEATARRGERVPPASWPNTIEERTGRAAERLLPDLVDTGRRDA
ncbi:hypothetical protein [Streptosporangium roseum]|uniref:Methyltransferase type 11 n=1 Tax=Streptosporangium roseum (strain ATCC 12428 / DSM 43021 / JCM 3005 / KCTC 9067 / NCIMB 10171 / NRRL 2505 / NI 9100) TaxID=479432 RepID=D2AUH5_STRRD|nr:hypothetical protein [Streptosporangium roseum]ACZ84837.1 methyltransferase type 11 [Streptosporangium roseum DSM 43021]